jgi:RNA polymerase sigma-70 factor (ECF subfamily)
VVLVLRPSRTPRHDVPASDETDAVLVARAQVDKAAFESLYLRYIEEIARFCYVRLRDEDAARDATQQIFVRAFTGLARYRETGHFRAWLYTIARHVLIDGESSRRHTLTLDAASDIVDPGPSPEDASAAALDRRALWDAVRRLPEDQRMAVELRLAGLTGREIAAAMGRSHDAAKHLQLRAVEKLRRDLAASSAAPEDYRGPG